MGFSTIFPKHFKCKWPLVRFFGCICWVRSLSYVLHRLCGTDWSDKRVVKRNGILEGRSHRYVGLRLAGVFMLAQVSSTFVRQNGTIQPMPTQMPVLYMFCPGKFVLWQTCLDAWRRWHSHQVFPSTPRASDLLYFLWDFVITFIETGRGCSAAQVARDGRTFCLVCVCAGSPTLCF